MKLTFVGTGSMACEQRALSSVLVDDQILFDIGSGTVNRLKDLSKKTTLIKYITITHFHSDHFSDIVFFLYRRHIRKENENELTLIGPVGLRQKVSDLFNLTHNFSLEQFNAFVANEKIEFVELDNAKCTKNDLQLEAFTVSHGGSFCNGYLLTKNSIKFVFTGDVVLSDDLLKLISKGDYICIDATMIEPLKTHLGLNELSQIAKSNKNKKFFPLHRNDYEIKGYPKNILFKVDGDEINLS